MSSRDHVQVFNDASKMYTNARPIVCKLGIFQTSQCNAMPQPKFNHHDTSNAKSCRKYAQACNPTSLTSYITFSPSKASCFKKASNSLTPTLPLALPCALGLPLQFSQLVLTTLASGFGLTVVQSPTPGSLLKTFISNFPPHTLRKMWLMGLFVSAQTKE